MRHFSAEKQRACGIITYSVSCARSSSGNVVLFSGIPPMGSSRNAFLAEGQAAMITNLLCNATRTEAPSTILGNTCGLSSYLHSAHNCDGHRRSKTQQKVTAGATFGQPPQKIAVPPRKFGRGGDVTRLQMRRCSHRSVWDDDSSAVFFRVGQPRPKMALGGPLTGFD